MFGVMNTSNVFMNLFTSLNVRDGVSYFVYLHSWRFLD